MAPLNTYEVDVALVGRRVELVFDPFDSLDRRAGQASFRDWVRSPIRDVLQTGAGNRKAR